MQEKNKVIVKIDQVRNKQFYVEQERESKRSPPNARGSKGQEGNQQLLIKTKIQRNIDGYFDGGAAQVFDHKEDKSSRSFTRNQSSDPFKYASQNYGTVNQNRQADDYDQTRRSAQAGMTTRLTKLEPSEHDEDFDTDESGSDDFGYDQMSRDQSPARGGGNSLLRQGGQDPSQSLITKIGDSLSQKHKRSHKEKIEQPDDKDKDKKGWKGLYIHELKTTEQDLQSASISIKNAKQMAKDLHRKRKEVLNSRSSRLATAVDSTTQYKSTSTLPQTIMKNQQDSIIIDEPPQDENSQASKWNPKLLLNSVSQQVLPKGVGDLNQKGSTKTGKIQTQQQQVLTEEDQQQDQEYFSQIEASLLQQQRQSTQSHKNNFASSSYSSRKQTKTSSTHGGKKSQISWRKEQIPSTAHQPHRRLLSSKKQSQSHVVLGPLSSRAPETKSNKFDHLLPKQYRSKKVCLLQDRPQATFLSKVQNGGGQQQLKSAAANNRTQQGKNQSHMQQMLSKITVFKKKLEIDEQHDYNRLGPSNQVTRPKHNSIYFNTNLYKLKLLGSQKQHLNPQQMNDGQTSSSSSDSIGSRSFRSKIAMNDAIMKEMQQPPKRSTSLRGPSKVMNKEAERLLLQQSLAPVKDWRSSEQNLAPVKDWTPTVSLRIQNRKHGEEVIKKHYEREAVAKYIYNKFGVHLLTFNHQTRNEAIPMFGEHGRQTTHEIFQDKKEQLQNRKNSAMRSQFVTLKRDLNRNGLPMPKELKEAEAERFIRKRYNIDEQYGFGDQEKDFMNNTNQQYATLSPDSGSRQQSPYKGKSQEPRSFSAEHSAPQSPQVRERPVQLYSHRQQVKCPPQVFNQEIDIYQFLPARPEIHQNIDNLEWQSTALNLQSLRDLYAAKCRDLQIEQDTHQFEKFCQHIISTARNRTLNLSNCYFKEQSAKVLARQFMMFNHKVASYDLSSNELGDNGIAIIAEALYRTSHIIQINLKANNIQWQGVRYLAKALSVNNSLINLNLSSGKSGGNNRNRVMERGAFELSEALASNYYLLILDLSGNAICNEGLSYLLPAIVQSGTLQTLNLTTNEITSGPIKQIVLKDRLRQGNTQRYVSDDEWTSLAPFRQLPGLEEDVREKKRYRLQTACLIQEFLRKCQGLKELILKSNKIGDEGMTVIAEAFSFENISSTTMDLKTGEQKQKLRSKLQLLNLTQTNITHIGFRNLIIHMHRNPIFQNLIVDKNNLNTSYNFSNVTQLISGGSYLKTLSMANCHLTDFFGLPFADALKTNRNLVKFNLYGNELTSKSLELIAKAFKEMTGSLEQFNLGKNNFDDVGGIKLGESLKWLDHLKKVNLSDNNLKDETAYAINRSIPEKRTILEVNLSKNWINLRVIEQIQQSCAKVKEYRGERAVPTFFKTKQQFKGDKQNTRVVTFNYQKDKETKKKVEITNDNLRVLKQHKIEGYQKEIINGERSIRHLKNINEHLEEELHEIKQKVAEAVEDNGIQERRWETKIRNKMRKIEVLKDDKVKQDYKYIDQKGIHEGKKDRERKELEKEAKMWEESLKFAKKTNFNALTSFIALKNKIVLRNNRGSTSGEGGSTVNSQSRMSRVSNGLKSQASIRSKKTNSEHGSASKMSKDSPPNRKTVIYTNGVAMQQSNVSDGFKMLLHKSTTKRKDLEPTDGGTSKKAMSNKSKLVRKGSLNKVV